MLKDIFVKLKICDKGMVLPISVHNRVISRGFYFYKTSHMRKPLQKFLNLQYTKKYLSIFTGEGGGGGPVSKCVARSIADPGVHEFDPGPAPYFCGDRI